MKVKFRHKALSVADIDYVTESKFCEDIDTPTEIVILLENKKLREGK